MADALVSCAVNAGVERFTVLGYSLGSAVAVRAATRHPGRVTGLILTAGFAYPDNRLRLAVRLWRGLLDRDHALLAAFLTLVATGDEYLDTLSPRELDESIAALMGFIPAGSPEQITLVEAVDIRAELPAVTAPTLVVATTRDGLASPESSRVLATTIPGAQLVEVRAGHAIATEARDHWLAVIRAFLTRIR